MRRVKFTKGPIGQPGNHFGIASGIKSIGHVRKQRLLGTFGQHGIGRGINPLHFIEDHTLVAERPVDAVRLDVPAFLPKAVLRDAREKDRIEIHVDQIVEILKIGAGYGIAGLVRKSERVKKRLQRPFEQLDERFLHGIFFRAAKH